jgi:hypothetical protein
VIRLRRAFWRNCPFFQAGGPALFILCLTACFNGPADRNPDRGTIYKDISRVQSYPANLPLNYEYTDYRAIAAGFHALVFNPGGPAGAFLWKDNTYGGYGLAAYVGDPRQGQDGGEEAVALIAALVSAGLTGMEGMGDYVRGAGSFFSDTEQIVLNNPGGRSGSMSFWYLLYPALLYTRLSLLYGEEMETREKVLAAIERWYRAYEVIRDDEGADFDWTGFDFTAMKPYRNGVWKEPDAAVGMALLFYAGYALSGREAYLEAVFLLMDYIESYFGGPLYELLMYDAPALAAELNVRYGRNYDLTKALGRVFDGNSIPRGGWGSLTGSWGGYAMDGLFGSKTDGGGYAFSMNTFAAAGALAPLARYDARYARDIGKWLLHLHSNARYFFPDKTPPDHQSLSWAESPLNDTAVLSSIPYEGIRNHANGKSPWFGGDPTVNGWAETDLSLYSGAHTGILGALFEETDVPGILRVDTVVTSPVPQDAYPTFLLYNPYGDDRRVCYRVSASSGAEPVDLFDAVSNTRIASSVRGEAAVTVPAGGALVVVELPAGQTLVRRGNHFFAGERYVSSARAAISIPNLENNQAVSGKFELRPVLAVNTEDTLKSCEVIVDDGTFRRIFPAGEAVILNTKDFEPGARRIRLEAVSSGGLTDAVELRLLFR